VPIFVPPLRQRREDIPALVEHFLALAKKRDSAAAEVSVSADTVAGLSAHDWPGNVRELRNVLDRALYIAAASGTSDLKLVDLPVGAALTKAGVSGPFEPSKTYREVKAEFEAEFERAYVHWLLARHSGNISAAAREAKMDRKYLSDLAKRHGLRD
jgi:DNA-binding NtrC family response regulator